MADLSADELHTALKRLLAAAKAARQMTAQTRRELAMAILQSELVLTGGKESDLSDAQRWRPPGGTCE